MVSNSALKLSPEGKALWEQFLAAGTKAVYETYFKWFVPVALECRQENDNLNTVFILGTDNGFMADFVSGSYQSLIESELTRLHLKPVKVEFVVDDQYKVEAAVETTTTAAETTTAKAAEENVAQKPATGLKDLPSFESPYCSDSGRLFNPNFTFNTFVKGNSNQLAMACASAVAEFPGRHNPLFIYGGSGLGKTHLLHAIGQYILRNRPQAHIVYAPADEFVNEVVEATNNGKYNSFMRKYRQNCDVLLLDDFQMIADKKRSLEEFFNIYNYLYEAGKQIVITSDTLPIELNNHERYLSRLQAGMIADIQAPELETRIAILQQKAKAESFHLPNDVARYIAQSLPSNIRQLEGALTRIMAHVSLTGRQLTLDYAKQILVGIITTRAESVSIADIQKAVSDFYHIDPKALTSTCRTKNIAHPRQVAMYLCRKHVNASFPALAKDFKRKDHTTVMSACKKIETLLKNNSDELLAEINTIEKALNR